MNPYLKAGFLVLALLSAHPATAQPGPLTVVEMTPQGELEGVEGLRFQIRFSHPMVALGEAASLPAPPVWLEVDPPVAARWRWADTALLVGEPVAPLLPATRYRMTVRAGVLAVTGARLDADVDIAFTTMRPVAALAVPANFDLEDDGTVTQADWRRALRWGIRRNQLVSPESPLMVVWNQPISPSSLMERVRVEATPSPLSGAEDLVPAVDVARWRDEAPAHYQAWRRFVAAAQGSAAAEVPVRLESADGGRGQVFVIRPLGCWPPSTRLTVSVAAGVASPAGGVTSEATTATVDTPPPPVPLQFVGRVLGETGEFAPDDLGLEFSTPVRWALAAQLLRVRTDGEDPWRRARVPDEEWRWEWGGRRIDLGELELAGSSRHHVCLEPGLVDEFGQLMEFPWCGTVRTGRYPVMFSLVEGDGVVEWHGPHQVPLRTRNVVSYRLRQWRIGEESLVPTMQVGDVLPVASPGVDRTVAIQAVPDRFALRPVALAEVLDGRPGVVLSSLELGEVVAESDYEVYPWRARDGLRTLIQVTSLGVTVKGSLQEGLLVWVTRLQDARPAAGVTVQVRSEGNQVLWSGLTDDRGLARTPPEVSLESAFLVTARDGDDLAYARTRWWEGHLGWEFNLPVEYSSAPPVVGTVWSDRGVVRPGEDLHLKAVVRRQRDRRLELLEMEQLTFVVRDSRGEDVLVEQAGVDRWGAAEAVVRIPAGAPLGRWDILVGAGYDRDRNSFTDDGPMVVGGFRVAEFRRPKFRVRVTAPRETLLAGDALHATLEGQLLAGGGMAGARARWTVRGRSRSWTPPGSRWAGWQVVPGAFSDPYERPEVRALADGEGDLDASGMVSIQVDRLEGWQGWPVEMELEGEIEDVDRQTGAGTARVLVLPGEYLVAVQEPPLFQSTQQPLSLQVAALTPAGEPLSGVALKVELQRRHWESVRRREVSGRYVFESRPVVTTVSVAEVNSESGPVRLAWDLEEGGEYAVLVTSRDSRGNHVAASTSFYTLGGGYTPWRLDQEHRMDLVVEQETYAPGDTARILVKAPWEHSTALVTVERAGVLESWVTELVGTMAVVEVPVREDFTPNVFISVVALRGRVPAPEEGELVDPGRPAYRVGYGELVVPPRHRRLAVGVAGTRAEYRPGEEATITVTVSGVGGPRQAAVTVWAVDVGVLELSGYRTPDLLHAFYARRGLGVATAESRSRLIGRRSYGTKGDAAGGGGGRETAGEEIRRDFRALAVWRGDVVTDAAGRGRVSFVLPDSLTTYRVMAVALAGAEEFGAGDTEILVSKPLGIEPALPRFLRPGDRARAGVVIRNRTGRSVEVEVTATLPAGGPVRLRGTATRVLQVPAGGSVEAGFGLDAHTPGVTRVGFSAVTVGPVRERDAMEVELPVFPVVPAETTAAFFRVEDTAEERIAVPSGVFSEVGGLEVRLASSLLVGATPAIGWLAEYPHACAEQVASQVLGLAAARRLGPDQVPLLWGGRPAGAWLEWAVSRLEACQMDDGGFAFWPGGQWSNPALSAHVAWALAAAARAGAPVPERVTLRAAQYLSRQLRGVSAGPEEGAWLDQVLAAFALTEMGRSEPAFLQVLFERRRTGEPLWGRAVLAAAMLTADPRDSRAAELLREVRNGIAREGRTARLEEPVPSWGWRFWWGSGRGTAAALLAETAADSRGSLVAPLAREVVDRLSRERARTTQELAWLLQALAAVGDAEGSSDGERTVRARLAGRELVTGRFATGDRREQRMEVPMAVLQQHAADASEPTLALQISVEGRGAVYGTALLRSAPSDPRRPGRSLGIELDRRLLAGDGERVTAVPAGADLVLEVTVRLTSTRRFLAVVVPLPAGMEPVDPDLATTARRLREVDGSDAAGGQYGSRWSGFDHVELRDDRVLLYATTLGPGEHTFRVPCRATTTGSFHMAPARAEEMYAPEVFGTTSSAVLEVRR